MIDVIENAPKRKILRLKLEKVKHVGSADISAQFVRPTLSVYMVWCPDGEMPKRVYHAGEKTLAISHAKKLAALTGKRFYVMRSWRGYDAEEDTE